MHLRIISYHTYKIIIAIPITIIKFWDYCEFLKRNSTVTTFLKVIYFTFLTASPENKTLDQSGFRFSFSETTLAITRQFQANVETLGVFCTNYFI